MSIDAPPAFEPFAASELQEPLPIRGKRSLSQTPAAIAARKHRANKKAGTASDGRKRRTTTRARTGPKSLAPEIGAFLSLVNGIIIVSPLGTRPVEAIADPSIDPRTVEGGRIGDELDAYEINALAAALDAQCRRSPRFRKYVESVLGAGSGGTLVTVLALIAARRAARHGVLPENIDAMAGMILAADVSSLAEMSPSRDPEGADPVTGETAPNRDAGDSDPE